MDSFRSYVESGLDDLFGDIGKHKVVSSKEIKKPMTLDLYRGFNADLESLEQDNQYYYLSPKQAEQGQLWFTHPYINYYNPIEYAKNHGEWFMTYKLPVVKHIQLLQWDDGGTSESLPDWWNKVAEPTSNGRFHAGIELPEGWVFSYKTEKFIGCKIKIKVPKQSVVPSDSVTL